ncbi:MAG TPA: DUF1464 family protein, partial [Gemmataceae bacterium]|nr:DUF1464 family protein [Gemmataceae bacterium]
GTSSLDLLILEDGAVGEQCRFTPEQMQADPALPVHWLAERGPFHLIAGPSGYGLPLIRAVDCTERDLTLMTLVRPDERGPGDARRQGVLGFSSLLRALLASNLPVIFLPGAIHLPTVPPHRKINRIDLGTADKLCVAALALAQRTRKLGIDYHAYHGCVIELGSVFTACMVLSGGQIVDGLGGTSGPPGWRGGGAWDGELAYLLSPLEKRDLFAGGAASVPDAALGRQMFRESLVKSVSGLRSLTRFDEVVLSGRLLESEPELVEEVAADLSLMARVMILESLPGAWVKHAAQGAALLADGLAGVCYAKLVEHVALKTASGTVLDWIYHPRVETAAFTIEPQTK